MKPRLESHLLLLLTVLAGAWSAALWLRREPSPGTSEPPAIAAPVVLNAPTAPPEAPAPGVKGRARVLTPGQRHRYTFDLDTRTARQAGQREFLGWGGALDLTYLGAEGGRHLFAAHVAPSRLEVEGAEQPARSAEVRRAFRTLLERPVYMAQDARGRVLSVHFDAGQDGAARRLVRSLLGMTQFVAEDGTHWSTEETDPTGDFESEYRAAGSVNTYVKTKRRYLRAASRASVPDTQGHLTFTLFENGHVREVTGSEVVETRGDTYVRTERRVALTCLGVDRNPLSLREFQVARAGLKAEGLSAPEPAAVDLAALDRQRVDGAKLSELVELLAKEPDTRSGTETRLAALLRLEPAEAERAARMVRQGTADAELASHVVSALASAGTPEAQRALVSVLEESRVRLATRTHAVKVAGTVELPTVELSDALERTVAGAKGDELRSTAALALGAMAKGLEAHEPGRSGALLEALLKRCDTERVEPKVCLRALTRAGSPAGLRYVRSALTHLSASVREAATEALQEIPGAEADALLDRVLLGDPDPEVRARAVVAISQRVSGPHMQALAMVLRDEPSEQVRLEVVRMLGNVKTVEPAALALLRDVAANDESPTVRRLASSLLAG